MLSIHEEWGFVELPRGRQIGERGEKNLFPEFRLFFSLLFSELGRVGMGRKGGKKGKVEWKRKCSFFLDFIASLPKKTKQNKTKKEKGMGGGRCGRVGKIS